MYALKKWLEYGRMSTKLCIGAAMRRVLAWITIILAIGAFALVSLIFVLRVNIIIPIVMFAAALVLLYVVKRMPVDETGITKSKSNETAFFDGSDDENKR